MLSRRFGVSPLLLTEEGIASTTMVFPIKFLSIKENHLVLYGKDVLRDLETDKKHLKLRCQQETLNLLMRLRRHYLTSGGKGLAERVDRSFGHFIELLGRILSLTETSRASKEQVIDIAGDRIDFDAEVLHRIENILKSGSNISAEDAEWVFDGFLRVVTQVARYTERLESENQ